MSQQWDEGDKYVYEFITRDECGNLHHYRQPCEVDEGVLVSTDEPTDLGKPRDRFDLSGEHCDLSECDVEDGHAFLGHRLTSLGDYWGSY